MVKALRNILSVSVTPGICDFYSFPQSLSHRKFGGELEVRAGGAGSTRVRELRITLGALGHPSARSRHSAVIGSEEFDITDAHIATVCRY